MKKLLFAIGLISLLSFSCEQNRGTKAYLPRIDSLQTALEESASGFLEIDTAIIHKNSRQIDQQLALLFALNNKQDQSYVNSYNSIKKTFFDVTKAYPIVADELAYTRNQLSDLKDDVENRRLKQDNVRLYFNQEKQSVKVLKLKMDFYLERANAGLQQFYDIYPDIRKRLDSLTEE